MSKMNSIIKETWLKALRSGQYKQTISMLKKGNNFCCLGVLCDLYAEEKGKKWQDWGDGSGKWEMCGATEILPKEVSRWAGLGQENDDPIVTPNEEWEDRQSLSELNDGGFSFREIADMIEEQM